MSDWLDGWAQRSARRRGRDLPDDRGSGGLSRRDLLKRAGIVAGAAWTLPLIQSAVAPASAASGATGLGNRCRVDGDCAGAYVCTGGYCAPPNKQWAGGPCPNGASDCLSGSCNNHKHHPTCNPGPTGSTCATHHDCKGNVNCADNKICGGLGASCGHDSDRCAAGLTCSHRWHVCVAA